jgi:hypothetical protein
MGIASSSVRSSSSSGADALRCGLDRAFAPLVRAALPALSLLALSIAPLRAGSDPPLPRPLRIEVVEGTRRSPASLRQDVDAALRVRFADGECVARVVDPAPAGGAEAAEAGPLLLRVLVDDYREETVWDLGIAERSQPSGGHDPSMDSHVELDVTTQVELRTRAQAPPIRKKTFPLHMSRSPRMPGEDTAGELRTVLVERIAKQAHDFVCKGSRRALVKDIEKDLSVR